MDDNYAIVMDSYCSFGNLPTLAEQGVKPVWETSSKIQLI